MSPHLKGPFVSAKTLAEYFDYKSPRACFRAFEKAGVKLPVYYLGSTKRYSLKELEDQLTASSVAHDPLISAPNIVTKISI